MVRTTGASASKVDAEHIAMLRERRKCSHFRILIIGEAGSGKTTLLEKACGVAEGIKPIIYDQCGKKLGPSEIPQTESGKHGFEYQITYPGSNFIFHVSWGFEAGKSDEMEDVWKFIEKQAATGLKNQLHAIWYCIPMDSPRPLSSSELQFFSKGTGKVPLVAIFTKFDAQVIQEYVKLTDIENDKDRWTKAKVNAENIFQEVYVPKVRSTLHPPKEWLHLEGRDDEYHQLKNTSHLADLDVYENNGLDLTEKTAATIDDVQLHQLFVSTQMNNLHLCVRSALEHVLLIQSEPSMDRVMSTVFSMFPHYWVMMKQLFALFTLFGGQSARPSVKFSVTPTACQVLVAINVISTLSFQVMKPFQESIMDALEQFKRQNHVEKLKTQITSESIPTDHKKLIKFLYLQIICI
ncbi:hypothetical protein F5887DRAFT_1280464 [Amanita rubescens]|nr:hypothetical protein F5887DRAFT_1280464 [Amanita rubescens]